MMTSPYIAAILRGNTPQKPVARTPIQLLRGNTYNQVNNLLRSTGRTMASLNKYEWGLYSDYTSIWRALGSNKKHWQPEIRSVWEGRTNAMQMVANELEQMPVFQGLNLTNRFRYEPWYPSLRRNIGAQVDLNKSMVFMGSGRFESPSLLVQGMIHEARHIWQTRQASQAPFGNPYLEPTSLREADAYLFGLEHRNSYGAGPERIRQDLNWFKAYCDINDRLSLGLPVDPKWGVSQPMNPVKRSDLELHFSFIEPGLRRSLSGPDYNRMWSRMPKTFSYQPWYQKTTYQSGSSFLRDVWKRGNR